MKRSLVLGLMLAAVLSMAGSASAQVSCAGVPAFASCTAYASGAAVTFNGSKYTAIAPIPNNRDCPPNSPYTPATDNWWTSNGTCTGGATATATRTATATATTGGATATRTATATATTAGATATRTATATATTGTGTNTLFQANYWTQGNDPCTNNGPAGSGEEWTAIGACSGQAAWSSSTAYTGGTQACRNCGGTNPTATRTPTSVGPTPSRAATSTSTRTATPTATSGTLPAPPATWQEHWFEHVQNMQLVGYNDDIALYFDADVNRSASTWMMDYITRMWRYAKATYGNANQTRLFSLHHEGKYGGGHPSYWYDASHDNRNVSDVGGNNWTTPQYDVVTHETAHIIESVAHGKKGSPAFGLWGDSKWAEIYQYDVFVALGMTSDAQRLYNRYITTSDSFPRAGTFWFRDWFYPLWRDHGHAQVMVRFNQLLGQYFPTNSSGNFTRGMNMGEFVHFMSGAANTNLKVQATTAFGWTAQNETDFNNARAQFPQITY